MSYPYVFCEESKEALAKFMKACKSLEDYNDPKEKERKYWAPVMKYFAPINEDSISSNPETKNIEEIEPLMPFLSISDRTFDIHDENDMQEYYIAALQRQPEPMIREAYRNVLPQITIPDILQMGKLIISTDPMKILVKCYCEELLFQMMSRFFRESLKELFQELYTHYNSLIINQLTHFISGNDELAILFLYLNSESSLEDDLLREVLISFKGPFSENYIELFDNLIHRGTEYDSLIKLTDILYKNALLYKNHKDYGKLLLKVIQSLGPQVQSINSKIGWILSVHMSMWKIKLGKAYSKYSEDA